MTDPREEEVRQWLHKAENDLRSSRQLIRAQPPLYDTAVYHCQQTAEKALKAYLTAKDILFQKVHVLQVLVEQCMEDDPEFSRLLDAADLLTPYATAFRYPGGLLEPDPEDVREALDAAVQVLDMVKDKLAEERPDK